MLYQSLREKGSTVFFLRPFLPFDSLLFLQVALSANAREYASQFPNRSGSMASSDIYSRDSTYFPTAILMSPCRKKAQWC